MVTPVSFCSVELFVYFDTRAHPHTHKHTHTHPQTHTHTHASIHTYIHAYMHMRTIAAAGSFAPHASAVNGTGGALDRLRRAFTAATTYVRELIPFGSTAVEEPDEVAAREGTHPDYVQHAFLEDIAGGDWAAADESMAAARVTTRRTRSGLPFAPPGE